MKRHNHTLANKKAPSQRQLKVGEQIRQILSEIIVKNELHDDVIETSCVSICEVRMSPDLRHGKAYVSSLMGKDMQEAVEALNKCEFHFRKELSRQLRMKFLPKIHFYADDTFFEVNKIESLLSSEKVQKDTKSPHCMNPVNEENVSFETDLQQQKTTA